MAKIIIVGAVAGGATCASQIRRLDKESDIIILKRSRYEFANCGLPYYIGHLVSDRHQILPITPDILKRRKIL